MIIIIIIILILQDLVIIIIVFHLWLFKTTHRLTVRLDDHHNHNHFDYHIFRFKCFQLHRISNWCFLDMRFVKNFTPPDFQAKYLTPLISLKFNSFGDKNTKNECFWRNLHNWQRFYCSDKSHLWCFPAGHNYRVYQRWAWSPSDFKTSGLGNQTNQRWAAAELCKSIMKSNQAQKKILLKDQANLSATRV